MNKVIAIGNLGKDVKFVDGTTKIANFSVATNYKYKDKKTTEWIRCTAFGKLAEICNEYLKSGSKVYVEGRLQTREWTDDKGVKKYSTEVILSDMKMLGGRDDVGEGSKPQQSSSFESMSIPEEEIPY